MSTQMLSDIAQIFVDQVAADWGLDYAEESLKQVDRLLNFVSEPGQAPDPTLVLSVGAYLGETTVRLLEGTWKLDEQDIADSSVVVNDCEMWPFRRARQRLYYGTERPLYAWYEMAKSAKTEEIQKLLHGQEQATMIRPTGHDPLVIKVKRTKKL
ncbi:hypothetical protein [Tumebacillus permanentifrigoris]|uniref:Uncharacterized protein n=1 Tax=Tumebacillus permanentifrigoris TaxID=378543 RepID=A0A316D8J1_9BACL|nr:hypothetical protein [Tumebacillus permanentifrigoris]PWK10248.1 hypothetical protein C7459_11269 [Tumebacillus permanentifrigoris]